MRLNVNPNRMELLRLRRRLVLARRGHKLLKDKLEELMRQFLEVMRQLTEIEDRVKPKLRKIFLSFALARTANSLHELSELVPQGKLELDMDSERILNLTIPRFTLKTLEVSDYSLIQTEAELDIGLKKTRELLPDLFELARLWKAAQLLSSEIEITRRRVNALEYILIPNIQETIAYISSRLEEIERSYQVQLMRVKEIVRGH
ncbi:MAG: V-type ATP synthase subunit D [Candidatus Aminicenantales bacterium]